MRNVGTLESHGRVGAALAPFTRREKAQPGGEFLLGAVLCRRIADEGAIVEQDVWQVSQFVTLGEAQQQVIVLGVGEVVAIAAQLHHRFAAGHQRRMTHRLGTAGQMRPHRLVVGRILGKSKGRAVLVDDLHRRADGYDVRIGVEKVGLLRQPLRPRDVVVVHDRDQWRAGAGDAEVLGAGNAVVAFRDQQDSRVARRVGSELFGGPVG